MRAGVGCDLGQRNWQAKRAAWSGRASGSLPWQLWLDGPFQAFLSNYGGMDTGNHSCPSSPLAWLKPTSEGPGRRVARLNVWCQCNKQ